MMTSRMTPVQQEICDRVGANSWDLIRFEFGGMTAAEIETVLNEMFHEDNAELAIMIAANIGAP